MQFHIVAVGSMGGTNLAEVVEEYRRRTDGYVTTEISEVDSGTGGPESRMREEAEELEAVAPIGGTWVALDTGGRSIGTEKFAEWVDAQMVGGVRYIAFFIGGAYGLDPEFREQTCDWKLSLSEFTLPHEMARAVLTEQLYRAMTVIRGEPYHK